MQRIVLCFARPVCHQAVGISFALVLASADACRGKQVLCVVTVNLVLVNNSLRTSETGKWVIVQCRRLGFHVQSGKAARRETHDWAP